MNNTGYLQTKRLGRVERIADEQGVCRIIGSKVEVASDDTGPVVMFYGLSETKDLSN